MSAITKTWRLAPVAAAMLSLQACDGLFGDLYDEPLTEVRKEYGFVSVDASSNSGRIYVNATSYTEWHYVDFKTQEVVTRGVDEEPPAQWDFALHRYDTKTNGGSVAETGLAELSQLRGTGMPAASAFAADTMTTRRIIVDMSGMMEGRIGYTASPYNRTLSRWLNVDTSIMPPIYTPSNLVYLLRMADGSVAALRLVNFMNDAAVKGYMTIDYQYPAAL